MNRSVGSGLLANTWRATERHAYRLISRPIPSKIDSVLVYGDCRRSFSRGGIQPVPKRYRQYVLGKSFASKTSTPEPTSTTIDSATSAIGVDKVLCASSYRQLDRRKISNLAAGAWRASLQREPLRSLEGIGRRYKSSISGDKPSRAPSDGDIRKDDGLSVPKSQHSVLPDGNSPATRHLIDRLPAMPHLHRPTKEELLAAATGFWSRLKVRFKWFSIRSVRPFNMDEIGAFFSWFVLGHVIWIIVGTTTFFSLGIFAINTVFAQGECFPGFPCSLLTASRNLGGMGW
jgi:distribution and morphology protein 31